MHYVDHITLTTGDSARQDRAGVSDATMARLVPWLRSALANPARVTIPDTGGYMAQAHVADEALLITMYTPQPDIGEPIPLLIFGVAVRSSHAAPLWELLVEQPGVLKDVRQPGTPWCAVVPYPALLSHPAALEWAGDFERCIAWAWAVQHPDLRAV